MGTARPASGRRLHRYVYTLVTTAIVLVFALAEWAAERLVSERSRAASTAIEIVIVLVAALVFRPIHSRVDAAAEAVFFRRRRQALAALARFRRELPSFNDLGQLLRRVIEAVDQYLDTLASAVYLRRDVYRPEASSFDEAVEHVEFDDPLVVRLRSSGAPARPPALKSAARGTHAFPMTAAGELVGFILVHRKHVDDDAEELQMFTGLAQDLASALVSLDPLLRSRKESIPNNIPADLPALIGRERETSEIGSALEKSRFVTITGPGGVGKTRVALQCAADSIGRHEHGAWFVSLAPIADGDLVAGTMLAALGAGEGGAGDDLSRLVDRLRTRDLLLVIDNCEQVVADVAAVVAKIRAQCPRVTIIATSREPLRVSGEHVYGLDTLRSEAAVELFSRRAASASPGFDAGERAGVVREICDRLDCIPLAIELAAARVRVLGVDEILSHLHERFRLLTNAERTALPRQQTLGALIQWSYDLLGEEERSLFRRLSAFRGSFALEAASAVSAGDGARDDYRALDLLTSLADKSLLTVRTGLLTRYRLLETIREFAAQKAAEKAETAVAARRHAAHFAAVAQRAYREFDTSMPDDWLERLTPDIDNLRAALEWTLEGPGDRAEGAQLAADSGPIFLRSGLLREGLHWCAAASSVESVPPATAGRLAYVASMLHNNSRAYPIALECAKRAVEHYRRSTDERGLIRALSQTAHQYARIHRFDDAKVPAAEAIERARALGEPRALIAVLRRCAIALPPDGIEEARVLFGEALETARRTREPEEVVYVLQWWGISEAAAGCYDRAIDLAVQALETADIDSQMFIESDTAGYALASGSLERADAHASRALMLAASAEHPVLTALAIAYCAPLHARSSADEAALLLGYATARLRELDFEGDRAEKTALANASSWITSALDGADLTRLLEAGAALSREEALALLGRSALGSAKGVLDPAGHGVVTQLR